MSTRRTKKISSSNATPSSRKISSHNVGGPKEIAFSEALLNEISSGEIVSEKDLEKRMFFWSRHFKLSRIPSHPFILSCASSPSKKMRTLLSIKPTRGLSGVQVIAVMLPPFDCPGKCIYCPSAFKGKKAPKSYTGFEPSTLRAQRLNYDPYKIVSNRIKQLDLTGNNAQKIELIFQGSSFTALPKQKQERLLKASIDAVIEKKSPSLFHSKLLAESSERRIVGITFETRPDLCSPDAIKQMLHLGGTRVELGVQNPCNEIYRAVNRGHDVLDVVLSTQLLKDSAFKVLYHLMPGLPGSTYSGDLKNFKKVFSDPDFRPDMVKFYPCLVIKGTKLYNEWKKGNFSPLSEKKAITMLAEIKSSLPKWVRVMRVNRDIPSTIISAGVKKTNLRQLVHQELQKQGKKCNCIRCREFALQQRFDNNPLTSLQNPAPDFDPAIKPLLSTEFYEASNGDEAFISFESKDSLFGFARLRNPSNPFLPQITPRTALLRELHVFGKGLELHERNKESAQHKGLGKELVLEAERIAREKFGSNKMVVISGLGVKEYYRKQLGYKKDGPYMSKALK